MTSADIVSSSLYTHSGNSYTPINRATKVESGLKSGVYTAVKPPLGPIYLVEAPLYDLPKKIYGEIKGRKERILNTFADRSGNTGILLVGEQGSGKTLLAHEVINNFVTQKNGVAIVINSPITGPELDDLISHIDQDAIVFIDEFEKLYDHNDQELMLSTMCGSFSKRKMFILTCNDRWRVNQHMINRPGRIYYRYNYDGLGELFIREYCEDTLKDKSKIDDIVLTSNAVRKFNFDMLKAIVEELNRYGEDVRTVVEHLNIEIGNFDTDEKYEAKVIVDNTDVTKFFRKIENSDSPLMDMDHIQLRPDNKNKQWKTDDIDGDIDEETPENTTPLIKKLRDFRYRGYSKDNVTFEKMEKDGALHFRTEDGILFVYKKVPKKVASVYGY